MKASSFKAVNGFRRRARNQGRSYRQSVGLENPGIETVHGADTGAFDVPVSLPQPLDAPGIRIRLDLPPQNFPHPVHHFRGGLFSESYSEDLVDISLATGDRLDKTAGDHGGLARTGAGGNKQPAVQLVDGLRLAFGGLEFPGDQDCADPAGDGGKDATQQTPPSLQ